MCSASPGYAEPGHPRVGGDPEDSGINRALVEPARVKSSFYTEEAVFAMEMERIWDRAWIYIGHESQLKAAGDYMTGET